MSLPDLRSDDLKMQDARVARAIAGERERCAKIAEAYWPAATDDSITGEARRNIAAAIRADKNG